MTPSRFAAACLIVLGPTAAVAQEPVPPRSVADSRTAPSAGGGLEVGAITSVAAIVPAFGGQVSVPVARRVHLEVSGEVAPWLLADSGDAWYAAQVQLRTPLREGARSRTSVVAGVSSFTVVDRWRYDDGHSDFDWETWLRPHAGVSWRWQRSRHLDLRLDLQGVLIGTTVPFVVPRVAFSTVWRREWSRL